MRIHNDPSKFGRIPDPPEPPSDEWFEEHCPRCKYNEQFRVKEIGMEMQTRILSMETKNAGNGQNTKAEVGIGDDVTINGVVVGMNRIISRGEVMGEEVIVRLNCGTEIYVKEQEINTIRPKIVIPDKDEQNVCKGDAQGLLRERMKGDKK